MYFYIYDSCLTEKKQSKIVSKVETRLASLDIAGKKYSLTILRSVREIIERILQKEDSTIVIFGKDKTFYEASLSVAGTESVLGFIPVESNSTVADLLGIPINEYAGDIISSRLIQKISLGKINNENFFSSLEFDANKFILMADNRYKIIPKKIKTIKIINLDFIQFQKKQETDSVKTASTPRDDYLEVLMGTPEKKWWAFKQKEKKDSLFYVQKLKIKPKKSGQEVSIRADQDRIIKIKESSIIELDKRRINLIVGKDRLI